MIINSNRIWRRLFLTDSPKIGTSLLIFAIVFLVALVIPTTILAADFIVSGNETSTQSLTSDNETGTITASGDLRRDAIGNVTTIDVSGGGTNITLLNQGSVSATGTEYVRGIISFAPTLTNSTIENANVLTVIKNGIGMSHLQHTESRGISVTNLDNTSILNSGTLSASGTTEVRGIKASSLKNGSTIINTGTLSANQIPDVFNENGAIGIHAYSIDSSSAIVNSGNLFVDSPRGTGIAVSYLLNGGTLLNSGLMRINISDDGGGTYILQMENGGIYKNTGSIFVNQTGAGKTSYGISSDLIVGSTAGTITNTGRILITTHVPSSTGYGVFSSNGDALYNSGTIEALDGAESMGANMYSVKTTGNVTNSGTMRGLFEAGNTTNSGRIVMPALTSTITGNYTQTGNGTLGITLFSDDNPANTKYSKLVVTGTANLASGSGIDVDVTTAAAHQELLLGQTLPQVIQAGAIVADPNTLIVTDNSALLKFSPYLSNGGTSLDLEVKQGISIKEATTQNGQSGVKGVAEALDDLGDTTTDPQITTFINHLYALPTETLVAEQVAQAAPVATSHTPTLSSQLSKTTSGIVQVRQQALQGLNSGDPLSTSKNFWMKPFAFYTDQDDADGVNGFDVNAFGAGIGVDREYGQNSKLGLAVFYTQADLDTNNVQQGFDIDAFSMMLYGNTPVIDETTNLSYQFGGGFQLIDSSRYISALGETAKADYTARTLFARVKLAKTGWVNEQLAIEFGPALSYGLFYSPSYDESGAGGMSLDVDSFDSHQLIAGLEGNMLYSVKENLELTANASLGVDLIDDQTSVNSSFQGGGVVYPTEGIDNSPVVYGVGLGLVKRFEPGFSFNLKYDLSGRGDDYMTHQISAKLNWTF